MNNVPVFLDVNVPMYAAGKEHPYRDACVWVLTEIAAGRLTSVIDTEIIQEILYRYGAMQHWDMAVRMATNLLDLVPIVYPVMEIDAYSAVQLFQRYAPKGVKARNLIHVAVMQNNGLDEIISLDTHFESIEGITRLDPMALFRGR